jgi:hypothetical protein
MKVSLERDYVANLEQHGMVMIVNVARTKLLGHDAFSLSAQSVHGSHRRSGIVAAYYHLTRRP